MLLLAWVASAMVPSCRREPAARRPADRLQVFVSIPPQALFVERLGGPHVEVEVLVRPGQEPHSFEPTLRQISRLSEADVYFRVGAAFEDSLLGRIGSACEGLAVVDTREGINLLDAGPGGGERRDEIAEKDPHTWLSPKIAAAQARTMCDALIRLDGAHESDYRANLAALEADLQQLDRRIAEALSPVKGRTIYVYHPAFGYFAAAYGLRQQAVETGGKTPSLRHITELIEKARSDGVKVIFVQPQFSDKAARTIAHEIGGAVVPMDPLAKDYIRNLEEMAQAIRAALVAPSPARGTRPAPTPPR